MEKIKWDDSLSVNNSIIDNQHKELFELTNELILNCKSDINSPLVGETLRDLLKYAKKHFKEEEKFLKELDYPKLEEHKKMHIDFIFKVAMFSKDVMDGKSSTAEEMIKFLVDWVVNHTSNADQDYKNYITKVA